MGKNNNKSLVIEFAEGLSSDLFNDEYKKIIFNFIKGKQGIYALYNENSNKQAVLYYVGLASDMKKRLKRHFRDHHKNKWNRFRIYLVKNKNYLKEMETIIIRIANPSGNKQKGNFIKAKNITNDIGRNLKIMMEKKRRDLLSKNNKNIVKNKNKKTKKITDKKGIKIGNKFFPCKYARDILVNTANWLIDNGRLQKKDIPIKTSKKRYLINKKPIHPNRRNFLSPKKLKNGFYVETNMSKKGCIKNSQKLLSNFAPSKKLKLINFE